jgi:hypothetical protein
VLGVIVASVIFGMLLGGGVVALVVTRRATVPDLW